MSLEFPDLFYEYVGCCTLHVYVHADIGVYIVELRDLLHVFVLLCPPPVGQYRLVWQPMAASQQCFCYSWRFTWIFWSGPRGLPDCHRDGGRPFLPLRKPSAGRPVFLCLTSCLDLFVLPTPRAAQRVSTQVELNCRCRTVRWPILLSYPCICKWLSKISSLSDTLEPQVSSFWRGLGSVLVGFSPCDVADTVNWAKQIPPTLIIIVKWRDTRSVFRIGTADYNSCHIITLLVNFSVISHQYLQGIRLYQGLVGGYLKELFNLWEIWTHFRAPKGRKHKH